MFGLISNLFLSEQLPSRNFKLCARSKCEWVLCVVQAPKLFWIKGYVFLFFCGRQFHEYWGKSFL
jgi:hypothetical protein